MILNAALFLAEFLSGYFFLGGFAFSWVDQVRLVALALVFIALVVAFQYGLIRWFTGERNFPKALRPLLGAHLPWVLGCFWPLVNGLNLPDPHNTLQRKVEILMGVILITHLFLFARILLRGAWDRGWKASKVFGWVGVVVFAGATCWTATVCDLSGDEPHYLLMAYSLLHDGDLDLSNNYANRDYGHFYHRGDLEPQSLEHIIEGRRYSHHPLGPVLLILPGFALAGRLGAALTMALLAALTLYLTMRVLEETGAKDWPLHAVGMVGLASSPLLLFAGLIYPEIPTACLVALSLLLFLRKRWGWLGLCLGLMLWMHNRNVLLVIPFLLMALYEIGKNQNPTQRRKDAKGSHLIKNIGNLLMGFILPVTALMLYFHSLYGVWTPLGAHNEPFTSLFRLSHFWDGFFGLLLDQECGLWFHFPIFGMAVTGGVILFLSKNPLRFVALGTLVFYYLFMSFYENLGLTPATRYMVGVTPLLLLALYPAVVRLKKGEWWTRLTIFSFFAGVFVNWILAAVPWMRYNKLNGENWVLKIGGSFLHLPLTAMNPAFQAPVVATKSYVMSAITVGITAVLSVWFLREKTRQSKRR
jgi:hypothetical protein